MVGRTLSRYATGVAPLAVLSVLLVVALAMMGAATQNSAIFGHLYSPLLVVNVIGIVVLLALILFNLRRLFVQMRAGVMGSRLTLRLLGFFVVLAVVPVSVVYFFSVEAFSRGIDNWFHVKIERALNDALALGRASLDMREHDLARKSQDMALQLARVPDSMVAPLLRKLRARDQVSDIVLYSPRGRIIASGTAHQGATSGSAARPKAGLIEEVLQGKTVADLDPLPHGRLRLRVLVPVYPRNGHAGIRILQVLQHVPYRYSRLGASVQGAFAQYEKLTYLRGPLKFGMLLTLTLVALLTLLIATWAALFSARRLATPLRDLADGTRAVAQGNYSKRLPVTANDELGVLVSSFNEMTLRIRHAQNQIRRSQREAEVERTYLETVLTHLSSGVLSFDTRQRLRTHNTSAAQILGADLKAGAGKTLRWLAGNQPQLEPFFQTVERAARNGRAEWHDQVTLPGFSGQRILIVRGTMLPGIDSRRGGHVVVFDDITTLIQAQRDAAWAEVARRLAHEIKNPLTPIQLAAERIRHKCMDRLTAAPRETLDRATRIIVQQVEAMKTMVNAFADYARPVQILPQSTDLNVLVRDVTELYLGRPDTVRIDLDLDADLPPAHADPDGLRQVLHNLLLNAHEALAATPHPKIGICTRRVLRDGQLFIEMRISDNGPGFAHAVRDRLFEPYVTTKGKGTGLGLAIVKKIVEEHGGMIAAENLDGSGSCLVVWLPVGGLAPAPANARRERTA